MIVEGAANEILLDVQDEQSLDSKIQVCLLQYSYRVWILIGSVALHKKYCPLEANSILYRGQSSSCAFVLKD